MPEQRSPLRIPGYCALCRTRCGSISVIEDGRLTAVEPDASHPTGHAFCAKGRAAPELVYNPLRILHPLKRTRPKGDPDPGWQRVTWDEALDLVASSLRRLAHQSGPETVAFSRATPSGSAHSDAMAWIERLMWAFGSPNLCFHAELCHWHKDYATRYTFGVGIPSPDFDQTRCVLLWGHNPSTAWLTHARGALEAKARGARLIVVDPRRAGLAVKADLWLRVRPGSDGALALGIAGAMIEEGWFDRDFVRDWTNGPLLVRTDTRRFLTERDLSPDGRPSVYAVWDRLSQSPVLYEPATVSYEKASVDPALLGCYRVHTREGKVECRPAFDLYAALCRRYSPDVVEGITWVPRDRIREAARLLFESRPVSYYCWTGVGQHTNATQTSRAISVLYALTGSFDAPGGNVRFPRVRTADIAGAQHVPPERLDRVLGFKERPLGPARWGFVTSDDLYRAILEGRPYPVRALVGFGANLVVSHADPRLARQSLAALEFFVQADLFMTPTAELADVFLPVTTCWESEALKVGFEISTEAESLVQLRSRAVEPLGETRSDTQIVFDLGRRLGLGAHFWDGDVAAAYRHLLGPSGVALEELRRTPAGIRVPLEARYRKYRGKEDGRRGFNTPSRKVEIYSELFLEHGYPPLPEYDEGAMSPASRPDLARRYPLILTCAKMPHFCHSQHRALPSLRRLARDPEVELHPSAAMERGIREGDWTTIETPEGRIRARARLNQSLDPRVVCGQYGWWQSCPEIGAGGYDPCGPDGANYNALIGTEAIDPVSGSVPHRAYLCQIRRAD